MLSTYLQLSLSATVYNYVQLFTSVFKYHQQLSPSIYDFLQVSSTACNCLQLPQLSATISNFQLSTSIYKCLHLSHLWFDLLQGYTVNTGTFESAVHGFAHMKELKPLRQALFPDPMPKYEYRLPKRWVTV